MSTFDFDAAESRIAALESQIDVASAEINDLRRQAAKANAIYVVGQRVLYRGSEHEITAIYPGYSRLLRGNSRYKGRKVLKSGALHASEFELFGTISKFPEQPA